MITNFCLTTKQLLDIANNLQEKITIDIMAYDTEIKALPTFIHPKKDGISGEAFFSFGKRSQCSACR